MSDNSSSPSCITLSDTIPDIITHHPETQKVFAEYGLEQYFQSDIPSSTALSLEKILEWRHIDPIRFLALLHEQIPCSPPPESLATRGYDQEDLGLLALMPCPLKVPFQDALSDFIRREWEEPPFRYLIESNANNQLAYYQHVENFHNLKQMPDAVISPGLNGYYYQNFLQRFKKNNSFIDVMENETPAYTNLDIRDPDHQYSVLGANIEVLLVNHRELGDLAVPERWSDLLRPEYENMLTVRGQDGFFCETVLLSIYAKFGMSGVAQFAKTVRTGSHPSQMVKAVSREKNAPPISILPLFFAKLAEKKNDISIIWPEEGPIVSPVTLIVKRDHPESLDPLLSFISGKKTGEIFTNAWFPSMTSVSPCVDTEAMFNWLGWEYITEHDIGTEIGAISSEFTRIFYGKKQ